MLLRTPWSRGRRRPKVVGPASVVLPEVIRLAPGITVKVSRRHADGSHCHHCPEDS